MSDLEAPIIDISRYLAAVEEAETISVRGRVTEVTGLVIKAMIPVFELGNVLRGQRRRRAYRL